jgi:predicted RNA methylase
MLNTQTTGLKRKTIDKYYTRESTVELCINLIKESVTIDKDRDIIIEPSAGNGSFISSIKTLANNYIFLDIEPDNPEIKCDDYLNFDFKSLESFNRKHLIGNPPFGRQSSLAIKFIKKSCEYCDTISFILPKSFKKDSLKSRFSDYFHLIREIDIPAESFMVNDKYYDVPCVFQIWEKKTHKRIVSKKLEPIGFKFVEQDENPDIAFRRVGVYAGKIDTNTSDKSIQSHYFIKFCNKNDDIIEKLKKIVYDTDNTVGPRSISKQELIRKFNELISQSAC